MVIGNGLFNVRVLLKKQLVPSERRQLHLIQNSFVQADNVPFQVFSLVRFKTRKSIVDLFQLSSVEFNDSGIGNAFDGERGGYTVVNGGEIADPPVLDGKLQRVFFPFLVGAKRTKAPIHDKIGFVHHLTLLDQYISFGHLPLCGNGMDVFLRV